jgi:hypothetical protein
MASKFSIGDKVDQAFSNHAEGTVVAIFTDLAGEQRYAVEIFGHRTIQIASEGSVYLPEIVRSPRFGVYGSTGLSHEEQ